MLSQGSELVGVEVKRTDSPRMTPSLRTAMGDLGLSRAFVVHAGAGRFPLAERVEAIGAAEALEEGVPG